MSIGNDIKPTFGSTTYVPDTATYVSATTSEATKYKEPKKSVIENEEDRFELSANYKKYLKFQRGSEDLHHQFDVENLTKDEYSEMCKMLKNNGVLNAEEYAWLDNWDMYSPPSGDLGSLPQKEYNKLEAMSAKHPDPFRMSRILHFAAKRRDEGNPISFDQMLELADPSKTPNWIDEDSYVSDIEFDSSNTKFDFSDPDKKYNWMDVITDRLANVDKLPYIKPEDKASFKNATMKMLDILDKIKNEDIKF